MSIKEFRRRYEAEVETRCPGSLIPDWGDDFNPLDPENSGECLLEYENVVAELLPHRSSQDLASIWRWLTPELGAQLENAFMCSTHLEALVASHLDLKLSGAPLDELGLYELFAVVGLEAFRLAISKGSALTPLQLRGAHGQFWLAMHEAHLYEAIEVGSWKRVVPGVLHSFEDGFELLKCVESTQRGKGNAEIRWAPLDHCKAKVLHSFFTASEKCKPYRYGPWKTYSDAARTLAAELEQFIATLNKEDQTKLPGRVRPAIGNAQLDQTERDLHGFVEQLLQRQVPQIRARVAQGESPDAVIGELFADAP